MAVRMAKYAIDYGMQVSPPINLSNLTVGTSVHYFCVFI